MKKYFFILPLLICFLFIPKTNALMSQTLVTNMDLSSPDMSSPYNNFMNPSYFYKGQNDYNYIINNDLSYCYIYTSSANSSETRFLCSNVPIYPRGDFRRGEFSSNEEFNYAKGYWTGSRWRLYFGNASEYTLFTAHKLDSDSFYTTNGSCYFSGVNVYKNYNDNNQRYFNSDATYSVVRYFNVFIRDDTTYNNVSSFTFSQNRVSNRIQSFIMVFENPINATTSFSYEKGMLYYNNNIFSIPPNDSGIEETFFSTTTSVFPLIIQSNTNFTYPDYDSNTLSYLRLYFKNDEVGNTEGTYYFYRNLIDATSTPMNNEYVTFTVNEDLIIPGEEEEENQDSVISDSIDGMNNNIMDNTAPDTSGLSDVAGWLPAGPVDSILTLPLTFLQNLNTSINGTCSPLVLPLPFVNTNMTLPCLNTIYNSISGLNVFISSISVIISSLMLYYYFKNLYEWVGKKVSLNNDESWGGI